MVKVIEHDDITDVGGDSYQYEESDQTRAFNEFREKFKDDEVGTIRVHRIPVTNKTTNAATVRTVYLFACPVDAFGFEELLEHIRDNYGGGTYRIIGTRAGHRGAAFNKIVEIESPRQKQGIPGADFTGGQPPGSMVNPAELVNQFGAVMLEFQSRFESMLTNQVQPMGDPIDQITKLATAMGAIMGMQQKPDKLTDRIAELEALRSFMGGNGGGGGESNIYSLLEKTISNFGPILGLAIAQGKDSGAIPATGPVQPQLPKPDAPEQTDMDAQLAVMKPQINFLLAQAKGGAAPSDVAGVLYPSIPGEAIDTVEEFLERQDYIELCARVVPEVAQHARWFNAWRDAMLALIDAEFDDDPGADADNGAAGSTTEGAQEPPDGPQPPTEPHVTPPADGAGELTAGPETAENGAAVAGTDAGETRTGDGSSASGREESDDSDAQGAAAGGSGDSGDP